MDREQMQHCLEVVAAYRASGQKSKAWAQANGVPERSLASWCAHSRRWQARLEGVVGTGEQTQRLRGRPRGVRCCGDDGARRGEFWRRPV